MGQPATLSAPHYHAFTIPFDTPAYAGKEVPEDLLLLILPKWMEATQKRTLETHLPPDQRCQHRSFRRGRDLDDGKRGWLDTGLPSASHVSARGLRLGAWR